MAYPSLFVKDWWMVKKKGAAGVAGSQKERGPVDWSAGGGQFKN